MKLLIVDDIRESREMIARHFEILGYESMNAGDGEEALEILDANKIDIVITDLKMPRVDGVELTGRIKKEFPLIRVVAITAYMTLTNAMAVLQNGADALLPKPLDMSDLAEAVRRSANIIQDWNRQLKKLMALKPPQENKSNG